MALKFHYPSLSSQIRAYIEKELIFLPKIKFIAKQKGAKPTPCSFFRFEFGENPKVPEFIYLPHDFGRKLCPGYVFPQYPRSQIKFTAQLRPEQIEACQEIWPAYSESGSVILQLPTAFGKSLVAAFLACQPGGKIAVIFTESHLGISLPKVFAKYTNTQSIMVVEDRTGPARYAQIYGQVPDVLLCMNTRIEWVPPEIRGQYQVLMIDELHEWCTELRGNGILAWPAQYVIGMTATLRKSNGLEVMMHKLCAKSVCRELKKPFLLCKIQTGIVPPFFTNPTTGYLDWTLLSKWIMNSEQRNLFIACLVRVLLEIPWTGEDGSLVPRKILLVCYMRDHVDVLSEFLLKSGVDNSIFKGGMDTYAEKMVLVGTYDKVGTGFDEENACADFNGIRFNTILLCSSFQSDVILEQTLGRVFRVFRPDVFDLVDSSDKLEDQYKTRQKWYNGKNVIYTAVDMVMQRVFILMQQITAR